MVAGGGGFSWGSKFTMALLVSFVVFVLAAAHGAVGQPGYHPFSSFPAFFVICIYIQRLRSLEIDVVIAMTI